jgi:gliding motility-associated-like protein
MTSIAKVFLTTLFILIYQITFSQVKADFVFDKNEGCGSLAVSFTDKSTATSGNIVDWYWDLGGIISTKQNPGIIFTNPGEFTICLTVKTSSGASAKTCKDKVIKIYDNPIADFSVDITEGCNPVIVKYKNLSKSKNGVISSWLWDIGGSANIISTTDSLAIISTVYSTEGNYAATLSVVDEKGCVSTITKPNVVKVTSVPNIKLDYTYLSTCDLPWDVKINNIDADPLATYQWDFGNGQNYTGTNPPIVKYNEAKDYTVTVIVKKGPCLDTITFANAVKANRITDFAILTDAKCANQVIKINETSNYTADSLRWDFGDGTTSNEANPEHIYATHGCYTIKLTKYIGSCVQEIIKPCIEILPTPIVSANITNGYSCLIPAEVSLDANADNDGSFSWTIKGNGLDTLMSGSEHNIFIKQFGKYDVSLTFVGENGCKVNVEDNEIDITKFKAELPVYGPKGCIPYDAVLSDSIFSNIPISSWYWEVGSNPTIFTSTLRNPVFSVQDTGTWDIKLIVENIYGCRDTIQRYNYIQGGIPPVVNFTANPLKECLKIPRQFTSFTSPADFWIWTYNDGSFFSFEENPEYTFNDFGVYDITLTAFHNGCSNQLTLNDYIEVYEPLSAFKVTYQCDDPYTIEVLNQSKAADIYYWVVQLSPTVTDTIRDSLLSSYTFPDRGLYFLSHYSKSIETGCDHIKTDSIFIVNLEASYTLDTIRGCAPLDVKVTSTIQDAVKSEFLPGQYTIVNPGGDEVTVTFTEGGILLGPQLVVTDRHGCKDTFQTTTPVEVSKINATIDAPDVICIPGSETFDDASLLGLGNIVSREWYFSAGEQRSQVVSPTFDVPNPGAYFLTLKLEDSWGCVDSVRKEILAVTLVPSFTSDTLSCTDKGVRFIVDADPTFLNAFKWTFGDGQTSEEKTPLHTFDSQGVFDVCAELFDSRGCSKTICKPKAVTIKNPVANFTANPTSAPCPPLLSNFTNLSTNAQTYTWDFGDNSGLSYTDMPAHVYSVPGSFDVTLYAEMLPGCVDTFLISKLINLLGPKANVGYDISGNCVPLEIVLNGESDKTYEYIWDFGNGQIEVVPGLNQKDTTVYIYDRPGKFIPKLLVSDDNGCSRTFTLDPIVVNVLEPRFKADYEPYCGLPSLVTLDNNTTSSSESVLYKWVVSGIKDFTNEEKSPQFIIDEYGKYNITLIASTVNCIDTITSDSLIEIAAIPSLDFEFLTSILCENNAIRLLNKSNLDYGNITEWTWNFDNGSASNTKDPVTTFSGSGYYDVSLSAITDKGCQSSILKTIQILPNTLIALPEDKVICIGDSINISANIISNTPYQLKWDSIHQISCDTCEVVNVKPDTSTFYYVNTQAESGCINRDSIKITVIPEPGPKLQLSSDTIVCVNGFIEISVLNYDSNLKYVWDQNDAGLDCYKDCPKVKASPNEDTYYSIVVTNSFGCFKEDSILVTVERSIDDFLIPNRIICEGAQTTLAIDGGNNPIWDFHPTLHCTNCDSTLATPTQPTLYWVNVVSDAGCQYRDSVFVDIIPLESIDAGSDVLICKGEKIQLKGQGIGNVEWSSTQSIQNANSLVANTTPTKSSFYYLTTTIDECVLHDSLFIEVIEKTSITAKGDTICPDHDAILSSGGNATNYQWYTNNKKIDQGDTIIVNPEKTTEYVVIGSRSVCINDTAIIHVKVHPRIAYSLIEDEYEIFINSKAKFSANYDEQMDYKYQWSPSTGLDCINCPEPTVQHINQSMRYVVTITDVNQCNTERRVDVKFDNKCSGEGFYIPNIFTPYNKDGVNDFFRVYAEDAAEFISVLIYDRWGEKIFTSYDIDETWDGMYKGQKLLQGVYTYIVTAKCDVTNDIFHFGGDITIIE